MTTNPAKDENILEKAYVQLVPHLREAEKRLVVAVATAAAGIEDKSLVRIRVRGSRIKCFQSVQRKFHLYGYSENEPLTRINDLVGIRVVCNNTEDAYRFYEIFVQALNQDDVIAIEDYIAAPQPSGYRAIHINYYLEMMGGLFDIQRIPCEVQIRTLLQDGWAELTHADIYKSDMELPEDLGSTMGHLASLLSTADEIAQQVRKRISRNFRITGPVDFDRINGDGIAYIFRNVFGSSPSEYFIRTCEEQLQKSGAVSLQHLADLLHDKVFRDRCREVYQKESRLGFSPDPGLIFMAGIKAAEKNEKAGFRYLRSIARKERTEIEAGWRNEILAQLPETIDEFCDEIGSLNIEEIAEACGIADSCAICGTTIVDPDSFAHEVAAHYDVDDSSAIFSRLMDVDAEWSDGGLCSYHAHQQEKDEDD